jgi:hypothetical protein
MSISYVQGLMAQTGHTSSLQSSAFGLAVTSGNTILVQIWTEGDAAGQTVTSVTDTLGNTYVQDKTHAAANNLDRCDVWRASNVTGGSGLQITVATSANAYITFLANEWSGLANSSPVDASVSNDGVDSSAQPSTGTFSTTNANDLILATFADGSSQLGSLGVPSGFTNLGTQTGNNTAESGNASYQIVSSTQSSIDPTWSGVASDSGNWSAIGIAYKAVGGGGGGGSGGLLPLVGCGA